MIRAAVLGHPISHSKSPLIHGHWLAAYGIDGSYTAIDITPDQLKTRVQVLIQDGYAGFNVTLPHKVAIMDLCTDVDHIACAIGAVNTVVIRDGALYGTNTDAYGFAENLAAVFPDFSWRGARVGIMGAGGAARAVLYAARQAGAGSIMITNRTREHAELLAQDAPHIDVVPWEERSAALAQLDILINTTSLGMTGKPPLEIDLCALPVTAIVYDLVYAPLITPLLAAAQARGNRIVTGIGMLLHQARPGFAAWFGRHPDVTQDLMTKVRA